MADNCTPSAPCAIGKDTVARICKMEQDIAAIKLAVIGNPAFGQRGLVERIAAVEQTVGMIEDDRLAEKATRKGALAVLSGVAALCGTIGAAVYSSLSRLTG